MTVVVPRLTRRGGGGWNSSDMMSGSLIFRRERNLSLRHGRLDQSRVGFEGVPQHQINGSSIRHRFLNAVALDCS
jgi:hypothetical protein